MMKTERIAALETANRDSWLCNLYIWRNYIFIYFYMIKINE